MQQEKNTRTNKKETDKENTANVLIVDNDPQTVRFMLAILARKGIRGHIVDKTETVIDFIDKDSCDLVFVRDMPVNQTDESNGHRDYDELLGKIRANRPELPVIMMTEAGPENSKNQRQIIERAVKAVRYGCSDYLIKPLESKTIEKAKLQKSAGVPWISIP